MKQCKMCPNTTGLVDTQDGSFCGIHYPIYKRRRAVGQQVNAITCENCGESVPPSSRCIRCGNHLNRDGSVMRIGGHPDC